MYHTGIMPHKPPSAVGAASADISEASELRYRAVADELEKRITGGPLEAGRRLPGEHELAQTFGVSRVTVRAALALLERKGLVQRRPGAGTFVAPPRRLHHDLAVLENLFGQYERQGIRTEKKTLDFRWEAVDAEAARALGFADAMRMERLWFVDGRPFAVTESYLHPHARSVSRAEAERTPAYTILERLGHHVGRADLTIRAEPAGARFARMLRIDAAMPMLRLQRTSFSHAGEPLERTTCYVRSDAIEFAFFVRDSSSPAPAFQPLPKSARAAGHTRRSTAARPAHRTINTRRGPKA
jgi:GntR family transcriptional regulator